MENYVILSIETHLFFSRIMKEHAIFLEAGFPCVETSWRQRADWFKQQFEDLLRDVLEMGDEGLNKEILCSDELVTEFTIPAERQTERLSGIAIDSGLSKTTQKLRPGCRRNFRNKDIKTMHSINRRAMRLLNGFINFKENLLRETGQGKVFNWNYPLLIQHTIREAKLYRMTVSELMRNRRPSYKNLKKTEEFWNHIMMEHAMFIRGLLDPSETEFIETAEMFKDKYKQLLEKDTREDGEDEAAAERSLKATLKYREFKAAGTQGILQSEIASVILPLLADHVLREANHYIRLLESADMNRD